MFTGLIAGIGEVVAIEPVGGGARVSVTTPLASDLAAGDSVAVDGVCLTAVGVGDGSFEAEAMAETLRRSTMEGLRPGGRVNLELALRVGDRLGGHIVQGHVDGVGVVAGIEQEGFSRVVSVEGSSELLRHLVLKGSVAVNGVSLTVSALNENRFSVSLIPETLERTTLGGAEPGDRVNIEVDVLSKHVEQLLGSTLSGR